MDSAVPRAADAYAALMAFRAQCLAIAQGPEVVQTLVAVANQGDVLSSIAVGLSLFPGLESGGVGIVGNLAVGTTVGWDRR